MKWRELTPRERRLVIRAILVGVHGDIVLPTGRVYRTKHGRFSHLRALSQLQYSHANAKRLEQA